MGVYTAGCSQVGGFSYAKNFTLYVELSDRDGNSSTNTSTVDYNVYCRSSGSGSLNANHQLYFEINGQVIRNQNVGVNVRSPNANIPIASGSIQVAHNNDGSRSITFGASISATGGYGVSASMSNIFTLYQIPRYLSSINAYDNGKTLNSIGIRWDCSPEADYIQYSLNNGNWIDAHGNPGSTGTSGTFTINGLSPNTIYNVKIRLRRRDSQLWSESGTVRIQTIDIARITNLGTFGVSSSDDLKVECKNPSGNKIAYFLDCPSGIRRITTEKTNDLSHTWTSDTLTSMLQYAKTSNSVSIKVGLITYGDTEYYDEKVGTLSVSGSNPIFKDFDYEDINAKTLALTGDKKTFVNGFSTVKVTISKANKAIARNGATMKEYKLSANEITTKNYSDDSDVVLTLDKVTTSTMTVYAIDSRGNSTVKEKTGIYKNYSELAITNLTAEREQSGVSSTVTLKFEGTYWNKSFGKVTNSIKQCIYKYKASSSSDWINGKTTLRYTTTDDGKFSGSLHIAGDLGTDGFDIGTVFDIRLQVADELVTKTLDIILTSGQPPMALTKMGVAFGQAYNKKLGGVLQANGIIYGLDTTNNKFIDVVATIHHLNSQVVELIDMVNILDENIKDLQKK